MRTERRLIQSPHFVLRAVECTDDHGGWSAPETAPGAQIVLVRRGRFRLDAQGRELTVEPTTGYLHRSGEEVRFAHPAGGDVCTSITLTGDALTEKVDAVRSPAVRVDARLELAHRLLLRSGADPGYAAVEALLDLLLLALRDQPRDGSPPGRSELADRAREAILADEPGCGNLVALARRLGTSPSHLSHTFRHHVGMPLSRYRNRVRVSRALTRLDQGETDLAALAAGLGFSGQAHLTRVMRDEVGHTPGRVRALLGATSTRPQRRRTAATRPWPWEEPCPVLRSPRRRPVRCCWSAPVTRTAGPSGVACPARTRSSRTAGCGCARSRTPDGTTCTAAPSRRSSRTAVPCRRSPSWWTFRWCSAGTDRCWWTSRRCPGVGSAFHRPGSVRS
ncbi:MULTISPECIES: AraC family transcriptional regulator [unclassified Nonomuraea]|uniref:helix-turn-helix domain-containing protein n=1 Tax=Nonomuraea sp. KC401 TaxID=1848324 RepID=UPI00191BD78B|nr:AraC family transcriptional regulator [Nonomuraea sp. KC401]